MIHISLFRWVTADCIFFVLYSVTYFYQLENTSFPEEWAPPFHSLVTYMPSKSNFSVTQVFASNPRMHRVKELRWEKFYMNLRRDPQSFYFFSNSCISAFDYEIEELANSLRFKKFNCCLTWLQFFQNINTKVPLLEFSVELYFGIVFQYTILEFILIW